MSGHHEDSYCGKDHLIKATKSLERSSDIALLILDLGARREWVVSTTPPPLYPQERPGTECAGGWVGPRAGLDRCGKSRPTGIRFPDRPARSQLIAIR
jgi:hypothetical protein